jgi:hypothetical protein
MHEFDTDQHPFEADTSVYAPAEDFTIPQEAITAEAEDERPDSPDADTINYDAITAPDDAETDNDVPRQNVLIDPITHRPQEAHRVPESLAADSELSKGYAFLAENADRLHMRMLLVTHGEVDEVGGHDVGTHYDLGEQLEALGARQGVLFVEDVNTVEGQALSVARLNTVSHYDKEQADMIKARVDASELRDTFVGRRIHEVAGTNVDVATADYAVDSNTPAEQAMAGWWQNLQATFKAAESANSIQEGSRLIDQWHTSYSGFVAYRNWFMIGKMGAHLEAHDTGSPVIDAGFLVGAGHEDISDELDRMGAHVSVYGAESYDEISKRSDRRRPKA